MPLFIAMQLLGGALAVLLIRMLYPDVTPDASGHHADAPVNDAVLPHPTADAAPAHD